MKHRFPIYGLIILCCVASICATGMAQPSAEPQALVIRPEKLPGVDPDGSMDLYRDPFHWPVLGTKGCDGPNLRTVILRRVMVSERILVCHTDARAPKVREIVASERVAWLFYHPKKKIQLRITGSAALHTDDRFADDQWAATGATSRLSYGTTDAPGTPLDAPSSGLPDVLLRTLPSLFQTRRYRRNFMSVACRIESIDWLILRPSGNLRARFSWDGSGRSSTWLVP